MSSAVVEFEPYSRIRDLPHQLATEFREAAAGRLGGLLVGEVRSDPEVVLAPGAAGGETALLATAVDGKSGMQMAR